MSIPRITNAQAEVRQILRDHAPYSLTLAPQQTKSAEKLCQLGLASKLPDGTFQASDSEHEEALREPRSFARPGFLRVWGEQVAVSIILSILCVDRWKYSPVSQKTVSELLACIETVAKSFPFCDMSMVKACLGSDVQTDNVNFRVEPAFRIQQAMDDFQRSIQSSKLSILGTRTVEVHTTIYLGTIPCPIGPAITQTSLAAPLRDRLSAHVSTTGALVSTYNWRPAIIALQETLSSR